jgi:hypothetical protein
MTARTAVKRGAALLDQAMPGWWKKNRGRGKTIDLDMLQLSSCHLCVLGQLYANGEVGYDRGLKVLNNLAMKGKLRLPRSYKQILRETEADLEPGRKLPHDEFFGFDAAGGWSKYPALTEAWAKEIESRRAAA